MKTFRALWECVCDSFLLTPHKKLLLLTESGSTEPLFCANALLRANYGCWRGSVCCVKHECDFSLVPLVDGVWLARIGCLRCYRLNQLMHWELFPQLCSLYIFIFILRRTGPSCSLAS